MNTNLSEGREKDYTPSDAQDISDIEVQLSRLESQIKQRNRRQRMIMIVLGGAAIIGLVFAIFGATGKASKDTLYMAIGILFYPLIIGAVMLFLNQRKITSLDQDIAVLSARKRIIAKTFLGFLPKPDATISYFDRLV